VAFFCVLLIMNDIFKIFKKRTQAGKGTNITDVIKDLNEKEQNEIMGSDVGRFERGNKSYLSISKSGRVKSKKTQKNSRILNEELFNPEIPITNNNSKAAAIENSNNSGRLKPIYDQYSDNVDSSATSSFLSSLEDLSHQEQQRYLKQKEISNISHSLCKKNNSNEKELSYKNFALMIHKNI